MSTIRAMNHESEDMKVFMSLVLSSQRTLYVYILSLVIYPNDADDILQETLALMWTRFADFRPGTDFTAWGKTIARYKALNYLKKKKSAKVQFNDEVLRLIESESGQVDNLSDRLGAMKKCIGKLPEKDRKLLQMRYYKDLSFKKIALRVGISKQSAYRSVSRVHCKLVQCIRQVLAVRENYGC